VIEAHGDCPAAGTCQQLRTAVTLGRQCKLMTAAKGTAASSKVRCWPVLGSSQFVMIDLLHVCNILAVKSSLLGAAAHGWDGRAQHVT
jgi:hypothetical protein